MIINYIMNNIFTYLGWDSIHGPRARESTTISTRMSGLVRNKAENFLL